MKTLKVLLLIAVLFAGFSAGLLYQKHREALSPVSPQEALRRASAQLVKAAEELRKTKTFARMSPVRLDEALLALHDIQKTETSTAVYNFGVYHIYRNIWSGLRKQVPAPVILELGPGSNLAQGVVFAMTGAKKYYGLDV